MATKEQIEIAIKLINEISGSPESGAIAELVKDIRKSEDNFDTSATKEVRIVEAKETR
jgi:hypothetical protein